MIGAFIDTPVATALAILLAAMFQPGTMAAQCQALVGMDGLRTLTPDGSLIRKLSQDVPSFAVWSPDGTHIASAFKSGEFRVLTADGNTLSRIVIPLVDPITDLHWILPGIIALKNTHDAPGLMSFMKLSPDLRSGEWQAGAAFGGACIPSPDSGAIACVGSRSIAIVQRGHKQMIFHPANPLDVVFKQRSVELRIGETVRTPTEPAFQVAITHGKFFKHLDGSPVSGEFEIQVTPEGGKRNFGVRRSGDAYELDINGAHWSFVLNTLDSAGTRFRIDIYKDDTEPGMTGIEWGGDGSRIFVWETTRRGDALITLAMTGNKWELIRTAMRLEPGTPDGTLNVHNGLFFDPDGKTATVESGKAVYRCVLNEAVCKPIASRPPEYIDTGVAGAIVRTKVLDWHCPAGN